MERSFCSTKTGAHLPCISGHVSRHFRTYFKHRFLCMTVEQPHKFVWTTVVSANECGAHTWFKKLFSNVLKHFQMYSHNSYNVEAWYGIISTKNKKTKTKTKKTKKTTKVPFLFKFVFFGHPLWHHHTFGDIETCIRITETRNACWPKNKDRNATKKSQGWLILNQTSIQTTFGFPQMVKSNHWFNP